MSFISYGYYGILQVATFFLLNTKPVTSSFYAMFRFSTECSLYLLKFCKATDIGFYSSSFFSIYILHKILLYFKCFIWEIMRYSHSIDVLSLRGFFLPWKKDLRFKKKIKMQARTPPVFLKQNMQ